MNFSDFCRALYVRRAPLGSQTKFIHALFKSGGGTYLPDEAYAKKLFSGRNLLSHDILSSFPEAISREPLEAFLRSYITNTAGNTSQLSIRCSAIAANSGLPTTLYIDPEVFVPALADWFIAIIKNPEDCNILSTAYQRRLEGENDPDFESFSPLYAGDKVMVTRPPSQQTYTAPFWGSFSHEWAIQNTGTLTWSNRSLQCLNLDDNGVRTETVKLAVPDIPPREFAEVLCNFETRGREGQAISLWQMIDDQGNNCFPNHSTIFSVPVTVVNPNAPRNEAR